MTFQMTPMIGDATETGCVKFVWPVKDVEDTRKENPMVNCGKDGKEKVVIPFNSDNKFMLSVHHQHEGYNDKRFMLCMKGASERVLARCDRIMYNGEEKALDENEKKKVFAAIENLADRGERVLAFAQQYLPADKFPENFEFTPNTPNFPMEGLCLAGLLALQDPPRVEVPIAVFKCQSAGIKVVMVTGDFPKTAAAIAKQVNIISTSDPNVKDQWEIQKL